MNAALPVEPALREGLLRVRGLTVRYGPLIALDGVDLDVARGEVVALAGENGAGKSTLVRCIAGDITPNGGRVFVKGRRVAPDPRSASRLGVAVVWQDLALCDNLDVAANLLLGQESRWMMLSETRIHHRAIALLEELGIPLRDTSAPVGSLSSGQRQLVAVARAMRDHPQLLILDEPTAALGVAESALVEDWVATLPAHGTTVLLVSHDVEQMFRLADRIVVLRHGRLAAVVDPELSHPDEVAALLSGQPVDVSARRQLSRLHTLSDQLASAEPSSSLSLILSALRAALGDGQLCIHVQEGGLLRLTGMTGLPRPLAVAWQTVPLGLSGGQIGRTAATGREVVSADIQSTGLWSRYRREARLARARSSWSVPFTGASGVTGVITVVRDAPGSPTRDELDLVTVYAGYASSALERDRLLRELTSRNRVLETIREVLETLAGPVALADGLVVALRALKAGLGADEVALLTRNIGEAPQCRGCVGLDGRQAAPSPELLETAATALDRRGTVVQPLGPTGPSGPSGPTGPVRTPTLGPPDTNGTHATHDLDGTDQGWRIAVWFSAPDEETALAAQWSQGNPEPDHQALMEDAANSLRLALEREASERVHREAVALRSSQALQRRFLSWLSHELRTPLTAIRGYASSLLQPDVSWDGDSQQRFLTRISDESARLGRLVDDLLDFSAIDAGILRLHPDWCDLALVLEAARACVPAPGPEHIALRCPADVPVIWADHDRLEQVFVNLLDNAVRHNPPDTRVYVEVRALEPAHVSVVVGDDGTGLPDDVDGLSLPAYGRGDRRGRKAGAGLGLSIARGIVAAHGGRLDVERQAIGTRCTVELPVSQGAPATEVVGDG
jgi:signal transduction histidine kinase/ABC-type multidrug transport system ATPase subunit